MAKEGLNRIQNTKYSVGIHYSLFWEPNKKRLKQEGNVDGIFPLITTDKSFSPKEVLLSHKYQPRLEKRFNQFKDHAAGLRGGILVLKRRSTGNYKTSLLKDFILIQYILYFFPPLKLTNYSTLPDAISYFPCNPLISFIGLSLK